jgi:xanthine dehydrogenase YagT iron-sulfur-binding subunit
MDARISLVVDGVAHSLIVDTRTTLLDALRDRLAIMSPKKGIMASAERARCCWTGAG